MSMNVGKELARLKSMTPTELREKYAEVYGEASRSGNKDFLIKRVIWRMQALEQGTLSERARMRAMELARDADLRQRTPHDEDRMSTTGTLAPSDGRLPMPGAWISREYKGRTINVRVLHKGFEYEGETYRSLSAVARAVTGSHWNGYLFFDIQKEASGAKSS